VKLEAPEASVIEARCPVDVYVITIAAAPLKLASGVFDNNRFSES
jgi:hypothetical protein